MTKLNSILRIEEVEANFLSSSFCAYLIVVFDLSYIFLFELLTKDWFLSKNEPYPYIPSLIILLVLLAGFWATVKVRIIGSATIVKGGIANIFARKFPRLVWQFLNGIVIVSVVYFVWRRFVALWPHSFIDIDLWLGTGLGTAMSGTNVWTAEWGFATLLSLVAMIVISLVLATWVLILSKNVGRVLLCLVCLGTYCWLFAGDVNNLRMLTVNTSFGTIAFLFAIVGIRVAFASEIEKCAPKTIPESLSKKRNIWTLIFGAIVVVLVALHIVLSRKIERFSGLGAPAGYAQFVPLSSISQAMQDATISMEDGHFYNHRGFDWEAIHHALRVDIRGGEIKQGGSTITQQLAKNLFLSSDRTFLRKVEEAAYTIELEHMLSKQRIVELYLNTIDYGMGQYGVSAAAQFYFRKSPSRLTLAESACLVGTVPDPMQGEIDIQRVTDGEQTALNRMAFFFPQRYSAQDVDNAMAIPLDRLMYPYKDAWDRGATEVIPGTWHGVSFYFFDDPDEPSDINNVSASLKPALAAFLDDAKKKFGLTGIDHLGVYNDRHTRQNEGIVSAHAFGQAIDISGFRFKEGARVMVSDHIQPKSAAKLAVMEACLKFYFPIVVDWRDDSLRHNTHFHCEVKGPRSSVAREPALPMIECIKIIRQMIQKDKNIPYRYQLWLNGICYRQTHSSSCASTALATIFAYYCGKKITENNVLKMVGSDGNNPVMFDSLLVVCHKLGYKAIARIMTCTEMNLYIKKYRIPVEIAIFQPDTHFVDVVGFFGDDVLISDPSYGSRCMSRAEFSNKWKGDALLVYPKF
jgi:hypothetical protein